MFLPARGSGGGAASAVSQSWPDTVLWRLGGFFLLLLLEGARCLANPSNAPGINNNNRPNVNVFMSEEEVKKLLGAYKLLYFSVCSTIFLLHPKFCLELEVFGTLSNLIASNLLTLLKANFCVCLVSRRTQVVSNNAHKLLKSLF